MSRLDKLEADIARVVAMLEELTGRLEPLVSSYGRNAHVEHVECRLNALPFRTGGNNIRLHEEGHRLLREGRRGELAVIPGEIQLRGGNYSPHCRDDLNCLGDRGPEGRDG